MIPVAALLKEQTDPFTAALSQSCFRDARAWGFPTELCCADPSRVNFTQTLDKAVHVKPSNFKLHTIIIIWLITFV